MNVYGPRQDYRGAYIAVIMKMLDAIDRGDGPTIMGDGSEAFDFVAVEDCGLANVRAMQASSTDRFYNVGTGVRTSLKELAEILLELTGSNQAIRYQPRSTATLVRNRIGDPRRATRRHWLHRADRAARGPRKAHRVALRAQERAWNAAPASGVRLEAAGRPTGLFERDLPLQDGVYVAATSVAPDYDRTHGGRVLGQMVVARAITPDEDEGWKRAQYDWYLRCYGYTSEAELCAELRSKQLVIDAGCGPGYKAAWFARLAPKTAVVAMDLSESVHLAARRYGDLPEPDFRPR